MPNIESLKYTNSESKFNRKPFTIDVGQFEYSASTLLTYGTIAFAVLLGLSSVTYMTVQQLKK